MINDAQDIRLGAPRFYVTECNNSEFSNFQWRLNKASMKKVVAKMILGCFSMRGKQARGGHCSLPVGWDRFRTVG